jgi:HSP20 family protein
MLMRFDPFRDLDRLSEQVWRTARTQPMPMDAYRQGDHVVVHVDLPGVPASSIDLTVEKNVLTITAERSWSREEGVEVLAAERAQGKVSRQLFLGEGLDLEHVGATYDDGVLTVRIPVAEQAKPRKVEVAAGGGGQQAIEATASAA